MRSKSLYTKIYVQSVLPVNPTIPHFPQHYDKQEHILILNKLLKGDAQPGNYTFVNIYPLFLDSNNRLDPKYTYEGLHLKPEAYVVWTAFLKKEGYF